MKRIKKKTAKPVKRRAAEGGKLAIIGTTGAKPAKAAKVALAVGRGADPKRVAAILAKLDEAYPTATCELKHENAFQLLISTILSAQCTDVRVNQVTQTLYKKYANAEAFAHANPSRRYARLDSSATRRSPSWERAKRSSRISAGKCRGRWRRF